MSKVSDFYAKVMSDEGTKAKLGNILGGKSINEADDEQLKKIGGLAKELGFEITVEEAKNYLKGDNTELDDDDLDAVAGGKVYEPGKCPCGVLTPGYESPVVNPETKTIVGK